jgi:hypothetical protein
MRRLQTLHGRMVLALLVALVPHSAGAADWMLVPFMGLKFGSGTVLDLGANLEQATDEATIAVGVSTALLSDGWLGVEGDFGLIPGFFQKGNRDLVSNSYVTAYSGNAVLTLPVRVTRESLRPYFVSGLGVMHASAKDVLNAFPVKGTVTGLTLGGGAIGLLSGKFGLRFDLRYQRSLGSGGSIEQLRFWRASVGVIRRF